MGPAGRLVTIKRSGADGPHFPLSLSTCLFGRGMECDIRIQLPVVSRQHCKIEVTEQKAVLFNFSSANPTQVNGSAIDGPVQLRHGDVITVVDRSFRYEEDHCQSGSTSAAFPGQRHGQAAPRRVSGSSFSSNSDGEVEGRGAARSRLTEAEGVSGEPPAREEGVGVAYTVLRSPGGPASRSPPDGHRSEPLRDDRRSAAGSPAGGPGAGSRGTFLSRGAGPEAAPSPWRLEQGGEKESPFKKLYESMKEELDVRLEKESVFQNRRKSGSRGHCAADSGSAGGSWGETPLRGSPECRRRPRPSSHTKAGPAPGQREEERAGEGPGPALEATASPGVPHVETTKGSAPGQCLYQQRQSGGQSAARGSAPGTPGQSEALAPKQLFPELGTPTGGAGADGFRSSPEKVFSRKRRSSFPLKTDVLGTETETPKPAVLTPVLGCVERKAPGGSLGPPQSLGAAAGSPGLSSVDVSVLDESICKMEGVPLKRRRVSFGGRLRPELFDENLPPNTPLKRGEAPVKRRSLVTHAPAVLKKIIKKRGEVQTGSFPWGLEKERLGFEPLPECGRAQGQPQESGKEDPSEIHLEVTAQNVFVSSPPCHPAKSSGADDDRWRASKPPASSGSQSPAEMDVPKRGGRRSSSTPSQRASVGRSQHGILRMIHSRRRSGASEANLIVARSWADIVKLSAKQTQAKAVSVKHGPPRQPSKRQRRANTPKKPTGHVYSEFSTGHANSPCTIVIGKAHVEKAAAPARPCRMLNSFVFSKKISFDEDLSGLTEMFKTPAKEKPKKTSLRLTAFSNSEGLFGNQFQVPKSEGKPPPCTPAKSGENVFPSARGAPEEPSDTKSASPALRRQYVTANKNMKTPPSETEPAKTASSARKARRSAGLRNSQVPGTERAEEVPEFDTVASILGRCLRKSPAQAQPVEGEMEENERAFATCERNIGSKENSEKRMVGRRSRKSSELNCAPRTDVIAMKRLQEAESREDLGGTHCLPQSPGHAEAPVDMENEATVRRCTPAKGNGRIRTPSRRVSAEALSVLRKRPQSPGDTKLTYKEPVGGDESMSALKKTPEPQQDSAEHVSGSRRTARTPKKKPQSTEDLAALKELFQTPEHIMETVTDDKTMEIYCESPKLEPVARPSSTVEDTEGDDEDIRAVKGTPEQKWDSAERVPGSRRRSRTPKRKVESLEDLTGFTELFQTPNHVLETETKDKSTKVPSRSPKPEAVSTPSSAKRRLRTPLGKVDMEEELSALRKSAPSPGETTHIPTDAEGDDEDVRAVKGTPEQKRDSAERVPGSRLRSRTPKRKVESLEDLTGFKELFQTPNHIVELVTEDKTMKMPTRSPKPEPVSVPTSTKRRFRTPLRKVEEELSALRESTPSPGETTHIPTDPEGDDEDIRAVKGTPEQKRDSAERVPGSRKRSRTPKRKVEPPEDLAGFKELFQTPNHTVVPVTEDKTMKMPSKSPKSEPVSTPTSTKRCLRTPLGKVEEELSSLRECAPSPGQTTHISTDPEGDDEDIGAVKGTPEQKRDSADHVTGSRRRSGTPKRKAEPTEDLTGFTELFQTPNHVLKTETKDKSTKVPSRSPKPEAVSTPSNTKRRLRTPLRKVEEELSALRKCAPSPGETTHIPTDPQGDKDIRALKGTPEQKQDSAERVPGSRLRSRTPKRKVESLEDLTGFKELFQTPNHIVELVTEDKTMKMPSKSPKPEPGSTPTSTKRRFRAPLRKVEEELSAFRKCAPSPGETTHIPTDAEGDDEDVRAVKGTPEQKRDSAERVPGSRLRSRTPKRKVESLEDLTGFKELFQTPNYTVVAVTEDKTMKMPSKSPKSEPVSTPTSTKRCLRTPLGKVEEELSSLRECAPSPGQTTHISKDPEGDDEDIRALNETPEQKWDSAERVTGSRRRSGTPKRKAEPTEDLTGFTELFQTPNHVLETETKDKSTKVPSRSPKPEAVSTPSNTKRRLRTPLRKVEEELSALRKCAPSPGETTHIPTDPEGDKDIRALKGTPEQKQDSAERVPGSRLRSRTPKRKVESLEDLTGFKELFQTPNHIVELVTEDKTMKMPSKSPKPEPGSTPTSTKRRFRTPLRKVEEELSAFRKCAPSPGETTHIPTDAEGDDEDVRAVKGTPEQKQDSAERVPGSRLRSRTPKRKVESLEDLTGFKELFQTPNHTVVAVTEDKTMKMPSKSPKSEPVSTPTSTKRCLRTPLGKVEEELLSLRECAPSPGQTTHISKDPEGDEDIRALNETPEQKWDSAERVTGSRRRSGTPKRKAEPTEDLTGFTELFQTPNHVLETETKDKSTKVPSRSPKPEAVSTPSNTKRRLRTPLRKVEEELSALRKCAPSPGETTHIPTDPEGDKDIRALKGTPEQKQDSAECVPGSRRSRTPTRVNQPIEDLAGFKELFQTPRHTVEATSEDKATEMPCKCAQAKPAVVPTVRNRRLKAPPGKVAFKGELSVLWRPMQASRRATGLHREPGGGHKDAKLFKESLEQKLHPAENVTASERKPRTRKEKAQFQEDPASLKEVLQIPNHTEAPGAVASSTEMPSASPQPEAVLMPARTRRRLRAPPGTVVVQEEPSGLRRPTGTSGKAMRPHREQEGADEAMKLFKFKESPEQKLHPAENVTASKRPRTRKEKAQFLEDPASLKELVQIPNHTEAPGAVASSTEMPSASPQPEAVLMPARTRRWLRAPPGTVAVQEEPSGLRRPTGTSGKAMRPHREQEGADEAMKLFKFKESPEQKLHPAENVTASKRPRTRKEKAQFLEDPASLKELVQIPNHTEAPGAVASSTEMPSASPQPEAVLMPARTRRWLRAPPGTVAVQEEPSGLRRPTGTSGKAMRPHREQEGADEAMKLFKFKESPEQKLHPAENVTASKRPRTRKEKAQFLEDPASLKELVQIPNHTEAPGAVASSTEMPSASPQPEAVLMPARTRRRLRAPPGRVAVQEEPSGLRRPTGTSGKAMRSYREPVDGARDTKVCKGSPRREAGPVGNAVSSCRLLRWRKGKAQPPHSRSDSKPLLQCPAQDEELGTDAAGVARTSTQTPDPGKPVTTSRRALRGLNVKPTEELVDSRDPVKPQSESSVTLSPKRKREDGSCAGLRRLRPRTCAQDAAEEKPPRKRQRTAPREQGAPPEPSEPKKGRRVLREGMEPVEDLPSANGKAKNKGRREDVTAPDKGVSLRSRLPNKSEGAEQRPELLVSAEKAQRKRSGEKPAKPSREVGMQHPEGGAQTSSPGDRVHERRTSPRPARRGKAPVPRGTEQEARASSVEAHGETREEKEGAPQSGFIRLRSRKVMVPPTGVTSGSQPKQRVAPSAKRPVGDAEKENGNECVKKMRTRARRGQ